MVDGEMGQSARLSVWRGHISSIDIAGTHIAFALTVVDVEVIRVAIHMGQGFVVH